MAANDPIRGSAFTFEIPGLPSQAAQGFQVNPTLAAGDVKVRKDGGAQANTTNLPTALNSGKAVQVVLTATEMTADRVVVEFSDQTSPAEWSDTSVTIFPSARTRDDYAFPATSGRSIVVDAAGLVDANMVKAGPTGSGTAQTARDIGGNVDVATSTRLASASYTTPPTVVQNRQEMDANSTKLANLDATVSSRLATSGYTAPLDASGTRTAVGLASANLDTQLATIDADVLTRLASGSYTAPPSAASIVAAMQAAVIEGTITQVQAERIILAAVAGKVSGAATTTEKFRDTTDSKDRITATVDSDGNRTAITLDPS